MVWNYDISDNEIRCLSFSSADTVGRDEAIAREMRAYEAFMDARQEAWERERDEARRDGIMYRRRRLLSRWKENEFQATWHKLFARFSPDVV